MTQQITALAYIRALLLLTGAVGQFTAGFAPDLLGWEQTISTRSFESRTLLIPGGGAFIIWLPLFFGNIAFAVFAALPSQLREKRMATIGWLAATAFWINTVRSLYEPIHGPGSVSLLLLFGILIPLTFAAIEIRSRGTWSTLQTWAFLPVLGQSGWISIASAAGVSQTALFTGFNPAGLGAEASALLVLSIWTILAIPVIWRVRALAYSGGAAWGLFWIGATNLSNKVEGIAWTAFVASAGVLVLTGAAKTDTARSVQAEKT
ncbi:MAG: hypothetical protein AAFY84_01705 [Pseudomonadota bacterium]